MQLVYTTKWTKLRAIGLHQAEQNQILHPDVCEAIHTTKSIINNLKCEWHNPVLQPGMLLKDI